MGAAQRSPRETRCNAQGPKDVGTALRAFAAPYGANASIALLRAVKNTEYGDALVGTVDFVDEDIRQPPYHPLPCSGRAAGAT